MAIDRRLLRWNGWGWLEHDFDLGPNEDAIWAWLSAELGLTRLPLREAVSLDQVELPDSSVPDGVLDDLRGVLGAEHVSTERYERAFHARGKSYHDLLHVRAGRLETAPDAVLYPREPAHVAAVLEIASRHKIAVVPFGGGSSVVGGVNGERGAEHDGLVTLDMTLMDKLVELDETSRTATFEAGIYGPQLEEALQVRGYTLGHYPQSFEFSTLGGWIAARGAGQQSNRYGRAEKWLVSATLATPAGAWETQAFPASAAGPDFNHLVAGSEGWLGVITQAAVRIKPVPEARDYRGYLFPDFFHGAEAVRDLVQAGLGVAMVRLSDASETRFLSMFSSLRSPPGAARRVAEKALEVGGYAEERCMMLVGIEGGTDRVRATHREVDAITRQHRGFPVGRRAGAAWYRTRFAMPYLRDPMLDRGVGVDTLETSTQWSNVQHLHKVVIDTITDAIADQSGTPGMVMAHISHSYADGASLYFTLVFPQAEGREVEQWQAIKSAASDAIASHGGTISHHHGVGSDHAPWLVREKGPVGVNVLRAIKSQLDPGGIMNPGKIVR